jgi:flagellar hook assembly protein FlgD
MKNLNEGASSVIPTEYRLSQNYPNPFNPSTSIQFDIPKEGHVVLKVYDMLGREVVTLVDDEVEAGSFDVTWNGTGDNGQVLPSGIYFYRIMTGEFVQTKKMVYMR